MVKKLFSCILSFLLIVAISTPAFSYNPTGLDIQSKNVLLVSLDTGEFLYEKGAYEKVYPASITKIMTTILMLESEKFNPDEKIAMTSEVLNLISGTGSSVSLLNAGDEITLRDLSYMVLMSSYGDCAYLAAIHFGGSVEGFIEMMNNKAKELGLKGTHYSNPVGLHEEETYTTPYDTYILTEYALKNKNFKDISSSSRYETSTGRTLTTTNFLIDKTTDQYYIYANGVKTGFTDEAGRCLVSTASYNGYNYMCLIFGAKSSRNFSESRELYRWAFNNFSFKEVADTENPIIEMPVELSTETDFVPLYIEKNFVSVLPKEADESTIVITPKLNSKSVKAPVKKGDILGTAEITYAEQVLGTVNLVAGTDVKRSPILAAIHAIKNFFGSVYMKVIYAVIGIVILVFIIAVIRMNTNRPKKRKVKYMPYKRNK